MPVKKLTRTAEKADSELNLAHSHSNKDTLDKITQQHLEFAENALHTDMTNVNEDAFREAVENTNLIPEDVPSDDIAYVRTNKGWEKLHHAEVIHEMVSRTDHVIVDVNKTDVDKATGQPVYTHYVNLSEDASKNIEAVPNKLNKLKEDNRSNMLVVGNTDGTVDRSNIDANKVITVEKLTNNVRADSKDTAASSYSVSIINAKLEQLSAGISSCRGCVVNAHVPQGNTAGIATFMIKTTGEGYANGEYITLDIPAFTIIPAKFKVISENNVASNGAIASLELVDAGYYSIAMPVGQEYDICGSGTGGSVVITALTSGDNTAVNTILPDPAACVVGDIIYVMQDEDRNFQTSIYICTETNVSAFETGKTWMYVTGLDKHSQIVRYN